MRKDFVATGDDDAGFVLVEALIALVIIVGLVGTTINLVAMFTALRTRAEEGRGMEEHILELMVLGDRLSDQFPDRSSYATQGQNAFLLSFSDGATSDQALVALDTSHGSSLSVNDKDGTRTIIKLDGFTDARFDYQLVSGDFGSALPGLPQSASDLLAVRLQLDALGRTWPVVLWSASARAIP